MECHMMIMQCDILIKIGSVESDGVSKLKTYPSQYSVY